VGALSRIQQTPASLIGSALWAWSKRRFRSAYPSSAASERNEQPPDRVKMFRDNYLKRGS